MTLEFSPDEIAAGEKFLKDSDGCNQISVNSLCARKIKTLCLDAKNIIGDCVNLDNVTINDLAVDGAAYFAQLCTQTLCTQQLIANRSVDSNSLCANTLNVAGNACINNLNANSICLSDLSANDACITGTLRVRNLLNCALYEAQSVYNTITTYTLGDFINFDLIIYDQAGDLVLTPTFSYIAPLGGSYLLTLQIDQQNLQVFNGDPILGVPVSNAQIFVNGIVVRQSYVPYLTFFNQQKTTLTSVLKLKAGDVVQCIFEVLALNQINGFVPIAGTVDILGNGSAADQSLFNIILLNVDCIDLPCGTPCVQACTPCVPIQCPATCTKPTPCTGCEPCMPCQCF